MHGHFYSSLVLLRQSHCKARTSVWVTTAVRSDGRLRTTRGSLPLRSASRRASSARPPSFACRSSCCVNFPPVLVPRLADCRRGLVSVLKDVYGLGVKPGRTLFARCSAAAKIASRRAAESSLEPVAGPPIAAPPSRCGGLVETDLGGPDAALFARIAPPEVVDVGAAPDLEPVEPPDSLLPLPCRSSASK